MRSLKHATQTVFGEGPRRAHIMFVGEQPGDSEDRSGHPFVGPAGRVLRDAMERAGIEIDDASRAVNGEFTANRARSRSGRASRGFRARSASSSRPSSSPSAPPRLRRCWGRSSGLPPTAGAFSRAWHSVRRSLRPSIPRRFCGRRTRPLGIGSWPNSTTICEWWPIRSTRLPLRRGRDMMCRLS